MKNQKGLDALSMGHRQIQEGKKKAGAKGFTLVELLVVIAILGVLATVSIVGYVGFTTQAKKSNDLVELAQAKTVLESELADGGATVSVKESDGSKYGYSSFNWDGGKEADDVRYYAFTYGVVDGVRTMKAVGYAATDDPKAGSAYTIQNGEPSLATSIAEGTTYYVAKNPTPTEAICALNNLLGSSYTSGSMLFVNPAANISTNLVNGFITSIGYAHEYVAKNSEGGAVPTQVWDVASSSLSVYTMASETASSKGCEVSDDGTLVVDPNVELSGTVVIPEGVTTIEEDVFAGNTDITAVILPEGISEIPDGAFAGCTSLETVVIPNSLKDVAVIYDDTPQIPDNCFSGCASLKTVVIPEGIEWIGDSTFSGCTSLTNIVLPESLKTITCSAFAGCSSLDNITLPSALNYIGSGAFDGCASLKHAYFKNPKGWAKWQPLSNVEYESDVIDLDGALLSNSETAAKYLTDDYLGEEWTRYDVDELKEQLRKCAEERQASQN